MKNIIFILLLLLIVKVGNSQIPLINIEVGQQVPNVKIEPIYDAPFTSASLQELSKDKLVIIDFWATWCAPCVYAFPKLDSLAKEFSNEVQFILATSQDKKTVDDFFNQRKERKLLSPDMPKVMVDTVLNRLFPHRVIPHYVWIRKGEVIAITEEVNKEEIQKALNGDDLTLRKKVDHSVADYNRRSTTLLDFLNGNSEKKNSERLESYSILTRFIPELGYSGGYSSIRNYLYDKNMRLTATNVNLRSLYKTAYGEMRNFISDAAVDILSKDSLLIMIDISGIKARPIIEKQSFSYEIVALESIIFEKMQQDLKFSIPQFSAEIVEKIDTCLVLEKINDKIESYVNTSGSDLGDYQIGGGDISIKNTTMNAFRTSLEAFIFRYSKYPIIDNTNYTKRFDIKLENYQTSIDGVNQVLLPYGLKITKKLASHKRLVIKDNL